MLLTLLALAAGVVLLAYAADQFVLGAARVALIKDVAPLVVGVVIIGFGTSAPEMLISGIAAGSGEPEISIGNVVGSNLANLSLVLGVGAMFIPLRVDSRTVLLEGPMTLAAVGAFAIVVQGGGIDLVEGIILIALLAAALYVVSRRSGGIDELGPEAEDLADPASHRLGVEAARTLLGLVGTVGGAELLLWGAIDLADRADLSEGFVGATIVAIGTSLPELVTVIQSARRRETDLIVGNLLGSTMFNALAVAGLVGLLRADEIDATELTTVAAIAVIVVTAAAVIAMRTAHTVTRWEGLALVIAYGTLVPFLA